MWLGGRGEGGEVRGVSSGGRGKGGCWRGEGWLPGRSTELISRGAIATATETEICGLIFSNCRLS